MNCSPTHTPTTNLCSLALYLVKFVCIPCVAWSLSNEPHYLWPMDSAVWLNFYFTCIYLYNRFEVYTIASHAFTLTPTFHHKWKGKGIARHFSLIDLRLTIQPCIHVFCNYRLVGFVLT